MTYTFHHVDHVLDRPTSIQKRRLTKFSLILRWLVALCMACAAVNTVLVVKFYASLPRAASQADRNTPLPRPNQYMRLESLDISQLDGYSSIDPLINYAPIMAQVSTQDPHHVFPDDSHRLFTLFGTVSPEDRYFLVNDTVSPCP